VKFEASLVSAREMTTAAEHGTDSRALVAAPVGHTNAGADLENWLR
jgi:hypothetical protein